MIGSFKSHLPSLHIWDELHVAIIVVVMSQNSF